MKLALRLRRIFVVIAATLILSCSAQNSTPDPAEVERQITTTKTEEIELVRATIGDRERAAQFIALLRERDQLLNSFVAANSRHRDAIARLDADYFAERSAYEALLAEFNRSRAHAQRSLVELTMRMKAMTTNDEWLAISGFQLDRLDVRQLVYGKF